MPTLEERLERLKARVAVRDARAAWVKARDAYRKVYGKKKE